MSEALDPPEHQALAHDVLGLGHSARRPARGREAVGQAGGRANLDEPMARLPRQLATGGVASPAVARILVAFPSRPESPDALNQTEFLEPLLQRELEVLTLLGQRDGNKEIAARLFIALGMVKWHALSIDRKLEVNDRRRAVARTTALGLLATR